MRRLLPLDFRLLCCPASALLSLACSSNTYTEGAGEHPDDEISPPVTSPGDFPATEILDDFATGVLSDDWIGARSNHSVVSQQLTCSECYPSLLWNEEYPRSQESYATLADFDEAAKEIDVVMLAQEPNCELIEVGYKPETMSLVVYTCVQDEWKTVGLREHELFPGDQLGGRIENDNLSVLVNGEHLLEVNISDFPYDSGKIGITGVTDGSPNAYADFGGGALE